MNDLPYNIIQINNILLPALPQVDKIGVRQGKMGIAIYLFQLYKVTGKKEFEQLAEKLLEQSIEKLSWPMPIDFSDGLTGIGYCFEYMAEQKYIDIDTDDFLETIDFHLQHVLYAECLPFMLLKDICIYYCKRLLGRPVETDDLKLLKLRHHVVYAIDLFYRYLKKEDIIPYFNTSNTRTTVWQYPLYLSLLGDMYRLDLFNHKVCQLLNLCLAAASRLQIGNLTAENDLNLLVTLCELKEILNKEERLSFHFDPFLAGLEKHIDKRREDASFTEKVRMFWLYKRLGKLNLDRRDEVGDLGEQIRSDLFHEIKNLSYGLDGLAGVGLALISEEDVTFDMTRI